ncbi:SAE2-domain-containing protein [Lojkania enalia]|uniref:SAE2-domain-containing protein n=1 Tax=Lojkania enalia TaxID=147567 RepID=A0A9P4KAK2_9PLEO|nr:SAE2-domain-containing protein [Didymosphaeria enalia]
MSDHKAWSEKHKSLFTRNLERVYDEVIEEMEKELKMKDEEHQQGLKRRDEENQCLSRHINQLVIKNRDLIHENNLLKHQVKRLESRLTNTCPSSRAGRLVSSLPAEQQDDHVGTTVSAEEYRHLMDKYNALNEVHQKTVQKKKYFERKNEFVMQKNKEMKESVKAWKQYCDRMREKMKTKLEINLKTDISAVEERSGMPLLAPSSPRSSTVKTPISFIGLDKSSSSPLAAIPQEAYPAIAQVGAGIGSTTARTDHVDELPEVQDEYAGLLPQHQDITLTHQGGSNSSRRQAPVGHASATVAETSPDKVTSSQSTEDEAILQNACKGFQTGLNIENDEPEITSERSLKRKRVAPVAFDIYTERIPSDGTLVNPYQVKEEQLSSPPAPVAAYPLLRKETLDLDELGPNIISTPRRRLRRHSSVRSQEIAALYNGRSVSEPWIKEKFLEDDLGHVDAERFTDENLGHDLDAEHFGSRTYSEPSDRARDGSQGVLQPLSPNVQLPNSPIGESTNKRLRRGEAREAWKYEELTESGDGLPPMNENKSKLAPNLARAKFNRKLQATKESSTPANKARKMAATNSESKFNAIQIPTPAQSSTHTGDAPPSRFRPQDPAPSQSPPKPRTKISPPIRPSKKSAAPPNLPQQPPLRSKPPIDLKLSDFKPNPAFNNGYSYAFAETVRKHADRACLPGCTQPNCCGSTFRTLAAALPPPSPSQEDALLGDYLGDAYNAMQLTQMSDDEHKELMLQARTRELAMKHGKHRQAYERHVTPPGFWRTDFPTTQEQAEDRRKAGVLERKMVEERWMEAMRRGGRWIFRDE